MSAANASSDNERNVPKPATAGDDAEVGGAGSDIPPAPPVMRRAGGREFAIASLVAVALVSVSIALLRLPPPDVGAADANRVAVIVAGSNATGNAESDIVSDSGLSRAIAAAQSAIDAADTTKNVRTAPVSSPKGQATKNADVPAVATIFVSGMPAGAEFRVDGVLRTARRLRLEPGRHILTVAMDGRVARADTLVLARDESRNWSPRMTVSARSGDKDDAATTRPTPKGGTPANTKINRVSACDQAIEAQSWAQAVEACGKDAGSGNVSAQRQLALLYQQGKGTDRNDDLAAKWFGAAANAGDPESMYQYAMCLERGRGVKRDQASAFTWYTKAGDAGNAASQYIVGDAYDRGKFGAKKDRTQALRWFQLAAAQNYRDAGDRAKSLSR